MILVSPLFILGLFSGVLMTKYEFLWLEFLFYSILHQELLIAKLKKFEFEKESLVYHGHVIGGGEQWPTATNVTWDGLCMLM